MVVLYTHVHVDTFFRKLSFLLAFCSKIICMIAMPLFDCYVFSLTYRLDAVGGSLLVVIEPISHPVDRRRCGTCCVPRGRQGDLLA